jgi:hypothetical protein
MNADRERRLLARAHALADTEDLAEEVTAILGGGRAARLDPDVLPGLAGAALALGADSLTVYRAEAARFADDGEFAAAVEEADDAITGRAGAAARLAAEAAAALDAARDALDAAHAELDDARAMPADDPCDGCHDDRAAAIAAAQAHIADAKERVACAQEAAAALGRLAARLRGALACLRRVMGDLAETYETVYELRRRGRVMPKDGDWLTGDTPAHPGNPARPGSRPAAAGQLTENPAPSPPAALAGVRATAVTRQIIALAERGGLRPRADEDGPRHGRVRIVVNGPGADAIFGAIYVGARTGRILHAVLTHGNHGEEKRYDDVASVRAVLTSWLALQRSTSPAQPAAGRQVREPRPLADTGQAPPAPSPSSLHDQAKRDGARASTWTRHALARRLASVKAQLAEGAQPRAEPPASPAQAPPAPARPASAPAAAQGPRIPANSRSRPGAATAGPPGVQPRPPQRRDGR